MDPARSSQLDEAVRVDEAAGIVDAAAFFGPGPDRLFGVRHRPAGTATGGVVICPAIHAEFEKSYRSEVLLGRELARTGVAVQRFHYRGMGHSDGDPAEATFDSMVEDALAAADALRDHGRIAFVGTRWGALVAAAAAARSGDAPVVAWEPMLLPDEHFRNAFRARTVRRLREPHAGGADEPPLEELRRTGVIDAVGYDLRLALYESATGRTLEGEMGAARRRVLLVQISRRPELRGQYRDLVARWRSLGIDVEARVEIGEEGSWFVQFGERYQPEVDETERALLEGTARWIAGALS